MFEKFIQSSKHYPLVYGLASGLYPTLYFFQKNYGFVNSLDHFCFFLITFFCVPIGINYLIYFFFRKKNKVNVESISFTVLNIFLFSFLLKTAYNPLLQKKITLLLLLISIVLSFFIYRYLKKIILFQFILALLTIYPISIIIFQSLNNNNPFSKNQIIENIKFKNTPNIYFIQPDGYVNFSALKKYPYNIDNDKFESFLKRENFISHYNFRSNYTSTILSNSSIFNMQHHYCNINNFVIRKYIISDNSVLRVLRKNNFKLNYISESSYLIQNRPKKGYDYMNILYEDIPYLGKGFKNKRDVVFDLNEKLEQENNNPQFYFIEFFAPGHIASRKINSKGKNAEKEKWNKSLYKSNKILEKLVKTIKEKDPNPLIVIMADHGGYVGLDYTHQIHKKEIKSAELVNSMYSTIFSIHWPNNINTEGFPVPKSAVNMFRYIFSVLSNNRSLAEEYEKNNSYLKFKDGEEYKGVYEYFDDEGNQIFTKVN